MYPTLSYLIYDITGKYFALPIYMFGLIMALAFLITHLVFRAELKRKEAEGILKKVEQKFWKGKPLPKQDYATGGLVGFLLGFKLLGGILDYNLFVDNPQEYILSLNGNFFGGLLGAAISLYSTWNEDKKNRLAQPTLVTQWVSPYQLMGNITMVAAVAGLLGAKVFHNLENMDDFLADPIGELLSFSGLTFYGGLICGGGAVLWYAKKNLGVKPLHMLDIGGPAMMLAYGLGRVGCHVSGDGDWGIVNNLPKPSWLSFMPDWFWAYKYPHNVNNVGVPLPPGCPGKHCFVLPEAVFPTPLYESIAAIIIFLFLWSIRKHIKPAGMIFGIYMILNGVERFMIELIRVNNKYTFAGISFTQAELIAVIMILGGFVLCVYTFRRHKLHAKPLSS